MITNRFDCLLFNEEIVVLFNDLTYVNRLLSSSVFHEAKCPVGRFATICYVLKVRLLGM